MATTRLADKPLVQTLGDDDTAVVVLSGGNNRRIDVKLLRHIMSCPPIDLTAETGADSFSAIYTYTKASEATPTTEQLRGMIVVLGDGTAITVDTLKSDVDYDSKKAEAYARGESLWYIDDSTVTGGYYAICTDTERGGKAWWAFAFTAAGTYTLMVMFSVTVEAGIYAREALLGGALLPDRFSTKQDKVTAIEGTATLTNTLEFPFNDSSATVSLGVTLNNAYYDVETSIESSTGNVGEVEVSDKLANGFKLSYTGSAGTATIAWRCIPREVVASIS